MSNYLGRDVYEQATRRNGCRPGSPVGGQRVTLAKHATRRNGCRPGSPVVNAHTYRDRARAPLKATTNYGTCTVQPHNPACRPPIGPAADPWRDPCPRTMLVNYRTNEPNQSRPSATTSKQRARERMAEQ